MGSNHFILKPNYPVFARGLGYSTLAGIVLILGAFTICVAYITSH